MRILRWISFLPAAAIFSYLAYLIGGFINNFSIVMFHGTLEGWARVAADAMASVYMGAAFVYAAVRIAPSAPKHVATATTALVFAAGGLSLWSSFQIDKFYAVPAILGWLFGGTAVLIATLAGEIVPYEAKPQTVANAANTKF